MKRLAIYMVLATVCGAHAPVSAQTPDTTSAWRYFPLEVGNVWEYERYRKDFFGIELEGYLRRSVRGDTLIADTSYVLVQEDEFDLSEQHIGEPTRWAVRFDTLEARVFWRNLYGDEGAGPDYFHCRLDAPFDAAIKCGEWEEEAYTGVPYESATIGEEEVETLVKWYSVFICGYSFAADVGLLHEGCFEGKGFWKELSYARVHGVEYGVERFPVANESSAPSASSVALSLYPNPARDAATLTLTLNRPQRLTLAVYDVLGRQVLSESLGSAVEQRHRLDLSALPTGMYLVRLRGDAGARATTRLTVQ